jgi:arylsulfate sulfotransferase
LFDNGDNRNYAGQPLYSRAVAYRIDPVAMTVRQVWQYGKERGAETFSRIVSDVDYHAAAGTVMFMPGAVGFDGREYGKAVEVDHATRAVVFEATITPPTAAFGITFHRVERLPLYPPD